MRKSATKLMAVLTFGASTIMMSGSVLAEEWPLVGGDYWEVTGIDIHDGGGFKYAKWLATEWRKDLEFAKSKGWIKDYMIMANVHARSDEPDLYSARKNTWNGSRRASRRCRAKAATARSTARS
jgi:hypothetical protein